MRFLTAFSSCSLAPAKCHDAIVGSCTRPALDESFCINCHQRMRLFNHQRRNTGTAAATGESAADSRRSRCTAVTPRARLALDLRRERAAAVQQEKAELASRAQQERAIALKEKEKKGAG